MAALPLPTLVERALDRYRSEGPRSLATRTARFLRDRYRHERARLRWEWALRFSRRPLAAPTLLRIDPESVETTLTHYPSGRDSHYPLGVFGGNWDRERTPLSSLSLYRSLRERFGTGVPWAETDAYRDARRQIEYGGSGLKGTRTVVELDERCREVDRLYEAIEREGYRSQAALADRPSESVPAHGASRQDPRIPDELKLAIGRDGEMIRCGGGKHRLAMAHSLDIATIPAVVIVRHKRWQALREEVEHARSPAVLSERARAHLDHPDVVDLVPDWWR